VLYHRRTDEVAWHRRALRTSLEEGEDLSRRKAMGRPTHSCGRARTSSCTGFPCPVSPFCQNVRTIAKYYTRIALSRLQALLDLDIQQTEETLARLVVGGTIWARVDRPAGIVNFRAKRSAEDVMNDWSSDMQKLLGLVEKSWMGMNAALAAQSRVKAA
jgi:hypothetical protein